MHKQIASKVVTDMLAIMENAHDRSEAMKHLSGKLTAAVSEASTS